MSKRQFVICTFHRNGGRKYTYHNDGPPVVGGDSVCVPDPSGDGYKVVFVDSVHFGEPPRFPTKAIIGLHVEEEPAPEGGTLFPETDTGR